MQLRVQGSLHTLGRALVCTAAVLFLAAGAQAKQSAEPAEQLVNDVMSRLLAVVERPEGYDAWPPQISVIDDDNVNAFAWTDQQNNEQVLPIVRVHRGLVDQIAEHNADRLAFILGHELAHLTLGHVLVSHGKTEVTWAVFERDQEIAADEVGMQLALKAGYSYRKALEAPRRFREIGHEYTSFEGVGSDHPSWADRIALLQDDEMQAKLWRSMSAFETGVFFLEAEDYAHAEWCLLRVVREFPRCYEAWANLGYAQLMQYCDALEPEDLREFDVGHLAVGGFYRRAGSLAQDMRGVEEELWFDAVGALQKALLLKDDLILAKANLALAYLVRPAGPDVGRASQLYQEVATLLETNGGTDKLDPLMRAALLVNSWVGIYHDDPNSSEKILAQLEAYLRQAESDYDLRGGVPALRQAVNYTQASALAAAASEADLHRSLNLFEEYLSGTSQSSSWWPLAYERYAAVAQKLGLAAKPKNKLSGRGSEWRPTTMIETSAGPVGLSDSVNETLAALGDPSAEVPVLDGMNLKLYTFAELGITILGDRRVAAIILNDETAPQVELRRQQLGSQPVVLSVGMSQKDLEAILGDGWESVSMSIVDARVKHRFYQDVGIAALLRGGKVIELVITVAPRPSGSKG